MLSVKLPELLSPAGNFEKMRFAFLYGADAVYLSGRRFGMRAAADNFSDEELASACEYAHALGKRVYVTVNVMPHSGELEELRDYLSVLGGIKPDAVIVADMGVLSLCRKLLPESVDLHISTQGATVNYESCRVWHELGAKRVVLARELRLEEIAEIRAKTPSTLELEAFIHGAMCVSFSGRCLLSEYYTGRDANRGKCAQPCRWIYNFAEEKRKDSPLTGEVHPEGTYIFGSKDMSLIEHIPELCKCGLDSLKIEGRMKSAYYAAVVTNCYRMALDSYAADGEKYRFDERLLCELDSVSHREYCTGYYFDHPMNNPNLASVPGYMGEKSFLATVEDYDSESSFALCLQRNKLVSGAQAELISPGTVGRSFILSDMRDENMEPIESAPHAKQKFYVKLPFAAKKGDIIRA